MLRVVKVGRWLVWERLLGRRKVGILWRRRLIINKILMLLLWMSLYCGRSCLRGGWVYSIDTRERIPILCTMFIRKGVVEWLVGTPHDYLIRLECWCIRLVCIIIVGWKTNCGTPHVLLVVSGVSRLLFIVHRGREVVYHWELDLIYISSADWSRMVDVLLSKRANQELGPDFMMVGLTVIRVRTPHQQRVHQSAWGGIIMMVDVLRSVSTAFNWRVLN